MEDSNVDVKIICDSINTHTGKRITTFQISIWKLLLAELNTHRVFSRNAASSRAVPSKKMRSRVLNDPFMPVYWGKNQSGMSASSELNKWRLFFSKLIWRLTAKLVAFSHFLLEKLGLHKQICNRIIEPWLSANVVITATEFDNFFKLRDHTAAQPEFQHIASKMKYLYDLGIPRPLSYNEWHIPYIQTNESNLPLDIKLRISTARCARVSYYYHDGKVSNIEDDLKLFDRLVGGEIKHSSPSEHQACVSKEDICSGNFKGGWIQHRAFIENN